MKPMEYPALGSPEYTKLLNDYKAIYQKDIKDKYVKSKRKKVDGLNTRWFRWKKKHGCLKILSYTFEELLTLPFEDLLKFYKDFLIVRSKKCVTARSLKDLENIFKYTKKYDKHIAKFFKDRSDLLKIYTCHYCDMAYINAYEETTSGGLKSQFDIDHFLPKGMCPPLALSMFNFVPSCPVCKERIKGEDLPAVANIDDLVYLCPTSKDYNFHVKTYIKLGHRRLPTGGVKHFIYFVAKPLYRQYVQFFHLEDRYDYHKAEALRLEHLKKSYSRTQIQAIAKTLGRSSASVREDIFNKNFLNGNHRCFSKFTKDILNQRNR